MKKVSTPAVLQHEFSTDSFESADRFEAWRQHIGDFFGLGNMSHRAADLFSGSLRATSIGCLSVADLMSSSMTFERTWRHASHQDSEYLVVALIRRGSALVEYRDQRFKLSSGDLMIGDFRYPLRMFGQGPFGESLLKIDCALFEYRFPRAGEYIGIPFRRRSPLFSGMVNYIASVDHGDHSRTQEILAQHALEVLAIALDEPLRRAPPTRNLLVRLKSHIEENLSNPDLSPVSIALHHRLSRRHLYRLFAGTDGAIAGYIRQRRLLRSRCMLADPEYATRTISEIAFEIGFNDVTIFGRAFRSVFGMSPREYRSAVRDLAS